MNLTQLLILQFIAHLVSDFYLQSDRKAKEKNYYGFKSKSIGWHILITFSISWLLSFQLLFIVGSIAISLTHLLVDGLKKYINTLKFLNRCAFYIDQILHLLFIFIVVLLFDKLIGNEPIFVFPLKSETLLIISGFILCTKPANILIKEIFISSEVSANGKDDLPNAGKLIGTLERLLTLTFILSGQFEAVGFLIAAKSILRYKNDDTIKTEYVLIGTMLSFGIAIASGVIINMVTVP